MSRFDNDSHIIVYDLYMKSLDLSIVVPTFNRSEKVTLLLAELETIFIGFSDFKLEIVISDNHSNPEVKLPSSSFLSQIARIVVPPVHLHTAEENLLFALSFAQGNYTWILGDDDIPLLSGVKQLVSLIKEEKLDLMIFNSMGFDPMKGSWSVSRLQIDKFVENAKLKDFIRKSGFWSLPSGFSTLVFRTSVFDSEFMEKLHKQKLKIYSHVTTLLNSYHDKSFAAIAIPLVQYSSNTFDDESPKEVDKDAHWVNYAKRSQRFYRDPWTYSFLRQIEILEKDGVFTRDDLFLTIDQGHLGNRFMLFDTILAFLVDELIYEQNFPLEIKISDSEIRFVLEYLKGVNEEVDERIKAIDAFLKGNGNSPELLDIRDSLLSADKQIYRRLVFEVAGGRIFTTPYGYYWTPLTVDLNVNFKSHSAPTLGPYSQNLEDLELLLTEWKSKNSLLIDLHGIGSLNTHGLNSLVVKFDKLTRRVPIFLRKFFK
jgi:glycosyltransferase involved in cell wall biosynthesis